MSRGRLAAVVAVLVLGAVGAGLFLWERSHGARTDSDQPQTERLLIGLNPQTVRRVRFRWGDHTVEFVRRHGQWEPTPGTAPGSTVRVALLVQRLATLRVRLARSKRDQRRDRPLVRPAADIKVWRGGARPVMVRLYPRGRRLLLTTSDRPGVYHADAGLLKALERELQKPQLHPVWPLKIQQLASVEIRGKTNQTLVRRQGRWFLEDSAALAPADSAAVGRLLRALQSLRVTHRLGQGSAAVTRYGLDKPALTLRVDDGTKRTLRLGGPCPRSKDAVSAALGTKKPQVLCVTRPDPKDFAGPFVSTRLFSVAADEIKALNVTRDKQVLALVNRPGGGGWQMILPNESKVDQLAAASFVTRLAQLDGAAGARRPPDRIRRVGSVLITPLVGSEERVDIHAAKRDPTLWAQRAGGGRWLRIRPADVQLLAADPVLLRSRSLCAEPRKKLQYVVKTQPGKVTELLMNERGLWKLVLLSGRLRLDKAVRLGSKLADYRRGAEGNAKAARNLGWKRPVLLVGDPDRTHLSTLLFSLKSMRAKAFVASRAQKKHGIDAQHRWLSYSYLHSCKLDKDGKKQCQHGRCSLELGRTLADGNCYARQAGDPAVFLAGAALCKAASTPVANRRAISAAIHKLVSLTLKHRGKTRRLNRTPGKGFVRPKQISPLVWESATGVLLQLAPLTARAVDGYGAAKPGDVELTAVLKIKDMSPIQLDFYADPSDEAHHWMVRKGLPVRYQVSREMVKALLRLATGK